ncbi:hypothetical protein ACWX0M_005394 [Pseudomonas aeruginosa]|uniref:hypothetical protein n=1 Tax=Pseudomonas aeruginosa TaxID=287 RepID=UPI000A798AF8|nr:hypothetical protein [Pseudomonas aeruginosa]ELQ4817937.1 hypothetical protein [Pseudomonas aeruginosa]MCU9023976.1 hypothetical protein [Pseudomonas aeruginosa]MCU9198450.1 hypothetical protein [Pseudomonas aeruginosa]HCF6887662.1 hypothetical protein [Pseudomonas aeruginosa]HCF6892780.1 hypothetical protein [Pseudomonas aeruginosa]
MHELLKMLDSPRSLLNFLLAILVVLTVFFTLKSGAQAASQPAPSFSAPKEADSRGKQP